MHVLVTGGTGFIGSHIVIKLLELRYKVDIIDDLSNSKIEILDKINKISNRDDLLEFHKIDLKDENELEAFFANRNIVYDCVIHLAGYKAVSESIDHPLEYYNNNLVSSLNLFKMMQKYKIHNLIFSSSASVYGNSVSPLDEHCKTGEGITNPYSRSKYMIEEILKDITNSEAGAKWKVVILRYFNPIGAHKSGLIGEDPNGVPNNLMPIVTKVIQGKSPRLYVYGNDYETKDGTCVRDFIHIEDLALGHIAALEKMNKPQCDKLSVYNLGTGTGSSVIELISSMEKILGRNIEYVVSDRRKGDIDIIYTNSDLAKKELNWTPKYDLFDSCSDQINYIRKCNIQD